MYNEHLHCENRTIFNSFLQFSLSVLTAIFPGAHVAGPPLLNGRCTALLRVVVSEMTYTVSSGTLNTTTPLPPWLTSIRMSPFWALLELRMMEVW